MIQIGTFVMMLIFLSVPMPLSARSIGHAGLDMRMSGALVDPIMTKLTHWIQSRQPTDYRSFTIQYGQKLRVPVGAVDVSCDPVPVNWLNARDITVVYWSADRSVLGRQIVPVRVIVQVDRLQSRRIILKGQVIGTSDIGFVTTILGPVSAAGVGSSASVIGKISKIDIPNGVTIQPWMLQNPVVVSANSRIEFLASGTDVQIRCFGTAMADGGVGDVISVMSPFKKPVHVKIEGHGYGKLVQ